MVHAFISITINALQSTGLDLLQLNNWFINARVRIWRPIIITVFQQQHERLLALAQAQSLSRGNRDLPKTKSKDRTYAKERRQERQAQRNKRKAGMQGQKKEGKGGKKWEKVGALIAREEFLGSLIRTSMTQVSQLQRLPGSKRMNMGSSEGKTDMLCLLKLAESDQHIQAAGKIWIAHDRPGTY
eukprot:1160688-Pelagomonas_calceolata.AAC.2